MDIFYFILIAFIILFIVGVVLLSISVRRLIQKKTKSMSSLCIIGIVLTIISLLCLFFFFEALGRGPYI